MNADLKNALLEVQAYFLEAKIYQNVVEFTAPNLTTNDLVILMHIHRKNQKIKPWVFRSDKEVKVVFFIIDDNGKYLVHDGDFVESDVFEMSLTDSENQPNQWGFGNELPSLIPDNVNSREEWIEYILTIHQIGIPEVISINSKTKVSDEISAYFNNKPFIDWITNNCKLSDKKWIYKGENYTSQGLFDVFINDSNDGYNNDKLKQEGEKIQNLILDNPNNIETDLTFEFEKIIEKEWVELGGSGDDGLPYSSFRKVAEQISDYLTKNPNNGSVS